MARPLVMTSFSADDFGILRRYLKEIREQGSRHQAIQNGLVNVAQVGAQAVAAGSDVPMLDIDGAEDVVGQQDYSVKNYCLTINYTNDEVSAHAKHFDFKRAFRDMLQEKLDTLPELEDFCISLESHSRHTQYEWQLHVYVQFKAPVLWRSVIDAFEANLPPGRRCHCRRVVNFHKLIRYITKEDFDPVSTVPSKHYHPTARYTRCCMLNEPLRARDFLGNPQLYFRLKRNTQVVRNQVFGRAWQGYTEVALCPNAGWCCKFVSYMNALFKSFDSCDRSVRARHYGAQQLSKALNPRSVELGRLYPKPVYLYGPAQCGKSVMLDYIIQNGLLESNTYIMNSLLKKPLKFFDESVHKLIVIEDPWECKLSNYELNKLLNYEPLFENLKGSVVERFFAVPIVLVSRDVPRSDMREHMLVIHCDTPIANVRSRIATPPILNPKAMEVNGCSSKYFDNCGFGSNDIKFVVACKDDKTGAHTLSAITAQEVDEAIEVEDEREENRLHATTQEIDRPDEVQALPQSASHYSGPRRSRDSHTRSLKKRKQTQSKAEDASGDGSGSLSAGNVHARTGAQRMRHSREQQRNQAVIQAERDQEQQGSSGSVDPGVGLRFVRKRKGSASDLQRAHKKRNM